MEVVRKCLLLEAGLIDDAAFDLEKDRLREEAEKVASAGSVL